MWRTPVLRHAPQVERGVLARHRGDHVGVDAQARGQRPRHRLQALRAVVDAAEEAQHGVLRGLQPDRQPVEPELAEMPAGAPG